jgi:hypothetical protein
LKVGFGIRRDAPIEEIEVDISSVEDEDTAAEEPDVEGEVEVEDTTSETESQKKPQEEVVDEDTNKEDL